MVKPDNLLRRVKGRQRLKPRQLAIVRSLAVWRENEASKKNRPRKWILSDEVMLDLARRPPSGVDKLTDYRGLHDNQIKYSGKELIEVIQHAQDLPEDALPTPDRQKKLSRNDAILADAIMAIINLLGKEHNITPSVLGSRKEVELLLQRDANNLLMQGWRFQVCGKQITDFLSGKLQLTVESGELKLVEAS